MEHDIYILPFDSFDSSLTLPIFEVMLKYCLAVVCLFIGLYAEENSFPSQYVGKITNEEEAKKALEYFSAIQSSLAPCGEKQIEIKRVGDQWLIWEIIYGPVTGKVAWRVWQISAIEASFISKEEHNWKIDTRDCGGHNKSMISTPEATLLP